jgi:hypothetical protein
MISNKTYKLGKTIWLAFGISTALLIAGNTYGDAPTPPSFKVIKTKDIAEDAKVESLLENSDPSDDKTRYKVGSVQKQQDGKQWLMVKGQKIFEGYNLSRASSSSNGVIAVSSFSGLHNQINGDGSDAVIDPKTGKNIQAVSSIWIIDASGAKHKITADDMHATDPVLSRDGQWLAFTGQALDEKGFPKPLPAGPQVYVVTLQNGVASAPVSLNLPSKGAIVPIKWDKKDQLVVLSTENENSSSYQLTWLQVTP